MRVRIPTPVQSYTGGAADVQGTGATIAEVLADLESRHPGLSFRLVDEQQRVRPHIKFFVNETLAPTIKAAVGEQDTLMIVCALSGG